MQVTEIASEGLRREYSVVVPRDAVQARIADKLAEIGRSVTVPGFRRGKAPDRILRQRYLAPARAEALEQTLSETADEAIAGRSLRLAGRPRLELVSFEDDGDLEYKLVLDLLPDPGGLAFEGIALERLVAEVGDEDVDELVANLAKETGPFVAAEGRAAEPGDRVVLAYRIEVDGEAVEASPEEGVEIDVGDGRGARPEIAERLVGAKAGDAFETTLPLPSDYAREELRSREALHAVEVRDVKARRPAEIDDAWARSLEHEDLAALRAAAAESAAAAYRDLSDRLLRETLMDSLDEMVDFEPPPAMVNQEFESIWPEVLKRKEAGELEAEDSGKSEDELAAEYRWIARRRVGLGLMLSGIAEHRGVAVGAEEVSRNLAGAVGADVLRGMIRRNERRQLDTLRDAMHANLLEAAVLDYVLELAEVTERRLPRKAFGDEHRRLSEENAKARRRRARAKAGGRLKQSLGLLRRAVVGEDAGRRARNA